ncbi:hypothetical protein F4804DRAFT_347666 [Jackrogersella minutella]|nr:hypothetical protein F4804DRAFT_347666 [Jackrogersella minutella]
MAAYPQLDPAYMAGDRGDPLHQTRPHPEAAPVSHQGDQGIIPLICYCCEKQQAFSDLSHLLTHVSSKAHLLELHNLEILSQIDERAAMRCRQFDLWYKTYNIKQLVLQRMEARGEKGAQLSRRSQTPRDTPSGRLTARRGRRGGRGGRGRRGSRGNTSSRGRNRRVQDIKYESDDGMNYTGGYDGPQSPSISPWQDDLNALIPQGGDIDVMHRAEFDNFGDVDVSPKYASSEGGSSYPSEIITEATEMNEVDASTLSLKGTVYPGMGLFDAAGEEQRRKRNQRKPPAVLQQLEINSTLVNTDEYVFDMNLSYLRTRDVYDDPSEDEDEDDDDDNGEEEHGEVEKKRKRRSILNRATLVAKKTRHNTAAHDARIPRASQVTTQVAQMFRNSPLTDGIAPDRSRGLDTGGRVTRSAGNHGSVSHSQLPLHNHGIHGEINLYQDSMGMDTGGPLFQPFAGDIPADTEEQIQPTALLEGDDGSEFLPMPQCPEMTTSLNYGLTFNDRHDSLPGFAALRPGNPNTPFASPSIGIKRSPPSHFHGKENQSLSLKQAAASSNPYLQTATSTHGENYNPLYVQPQDGLRFNMYSSYDEPVKPASTTNFQPINGHGGFNSLHMSSQHNATFPPNQGSGGFDM